MAVDRTQLREQRDLGPEPGREQTDERRVRGELCEGVLGTLGEADDGQVDPEEASRTGDPDGDGSGANQRRREQRASERRHDPTSQRSVRSGRSPTPETTSSTHADPTKNGAASPWNVSAPWR